MHLRNKRRGKKIDEGKISIALAAGGWQCTLPSTIKTKNVFKLDLVERNGKKWEVKPFYPLAITKKPNEMGA